MSELTKLLTSYCPNGVEYKKIGEIGVLFGGLTGKSKEDFKNGNAKFITYRNIYSNPSLDLNIQDKVKILDDEKQHIVRYGDILFTGSSETPDECGMSSVVTVQTNEDLYLNSFCFGLRLHNLEEYNLHFLKHLLRSNEVRGQIKQTASGVTRYNISKKRFVNISIPVPPIEVQTKIAEILDRFAEYAAELQAELQAREEQYEYYRNKLLSFEGRTDVEYKKLGEVCKVLRGKRLTTKELSSNFNIPVYHGGVEPIGYYDKSNREANSTMLINVGASAGTVGFCNKEFWSSDGCFCFSHNDLIMQKFLFYALQSIENIIKAKVRKAGIPTLDNKEIERISIPLPPIEVQERIVSILDKFETLVKDLSQGLPAEIEARQNQYEFYRNKLLSFKRLTT